MTLSSTTTKKQYAGDGTTTEFPTTFKFLKNADVKAIHRDTAGTDTDWVEDTDYTLTGAGDDNGGTVVASTAPASGELLTVKRAAAETQGSALPLGGSFPSTTVEQALDLLTMLVQQHSEELGRTIAAAEAEPVPAVSLELPSPTDRASQFLAFDALGALITSAATTATMTPVSTYIEDLLDDVDAAAARATLDAAKTDLIKSGTSQAQVTGTQLEVLIAGTQRLLMTAVLLKLVLPQIDLEDATAGSAAGPFNALYRAKTGANADLIGEFLIDGQSDGDVRRSFAGLAGKILAAANTMEKGEWILRAISAGTPADILLGGPDGIYAAGATGGAQGADTINAANYFRGGDEFLPVPRGYIDGLILANNGTDAANDLDISPGVTLSAAGDGVLELAATLVKQIDAVWAVGTNQGGLGTAAEFTANTTVSFENGTSKILGTGLFGGFTANDKIIIVGSAANSGAHDITAAAANEVTIAVAPTTEAAGPAITAYVVKGNTWYHVWAIRRSDTGVTDVMFHTAVSSPTLPANYDQSRMIGSILTNATPAIIAFIQFGDEFFWNVSILDVNTSAQGITTLTRALTVPTGLSVLVDMQVYVAHASTVQVYIKDATIAATGLSVSVASVTLAVDAAGGDAAWRGRIRTNTSGEITTDASGGATTLKIATTGYVHPRGRNL